MSEAVSVRFRSGNKTYFFDPQGYQVRTGEAVIVETAQGPEFAVCTRGNHEVPEAMAPTSGVIRLATDADRRTVEHHRQREQESYGIAERKIAEHGLEMKLVSVFASFDGNKLTFYFKADGRVDFRALVRDLASVLHCRIELRQIGVRDEAKMIGGMGICGRPFCCAQFLTNFLPVSIKMAKTQNLSLNPANISGTCGRLMCCLKYEQYAYEEAAKRLPRLDSFVQTPDGPGNVKGVDLLRETVKVALDTDTDHPKTYRVSEIVLLRNGKGGREGIPLPERPARYVVERKEEPFLPSFEPFPTSAPAPSAVRNSVRTAPEFPEAWTEEDYEDEEQRAWRENNRKSRNFKKAKNTQSAPQKQKREYYEGDPKRRRQKPWYRNNRHRSGG